MIETGANERFKVTHSCKQRRRCKAEALSMSHLTNRIPYNTYCATCRWAKTHRKGNRRRKAQNVVKPKNFSDKWIADHRHGRDEKM